MYIYIYIYTHIYTHTHLMYVASYTDTVNWALKNNCALKKQLPINQYYVYIYIYIYIYICICVCFSCKLPLALLAE